MRIENCFMLVVFAGGLAACTLPFRQSLPLALRSTIMYRAAPQGPGSKNRSISARLPEESLDLTPKPARQAPKHRLAWSRDGRRGRNSNC